MKLKPSNLLLVLFLFARFYGVRAQSQKRDVNQFEDGPTFDLNGEYLGKAQDVKSKLRSFVLDAWQSKKQVRFTVILYSREGQKSVSDMYIQKDPNGQWQILARWHRVASAYQVEGEGEVVYDSVKMGRLQWDPENPEKYESVIILSNSKLASVPKLYL